MRKKRHGRPKENFGRYYRELCFMRMNEVMAYIKDGWSASSACARAGIRWEKAREHFIQDEDFVKVYNESLARRHPSALERWGVKA